MQKRRIRVLMLVIGQDAHDRGAKVVTAALRDAGMEVIYTGPWQKTEGVAKMAIEEDVDIIGISSLSYDHVLIPRVIEELKKAGSDIPVIAGGVIPPDEAQALKDAGVAEVFLPGSSILSIVNCVKEIVNREC